MYRIELRQNHQTIFPPPIRIYLISRSPSRPFYRCRQKHSSLRWLNLFTELKKVGFVSENNSYTRSNKLGIDDWESFLKLSSGLLSSTVRPIVVRVSPGRNLQESCSGGSLERAEYDYWKFCAEFRPGVILAEPGFDFESPLRLSHS